MQRTLRQLSNIEKIHLTMHEWMRLTAFIKFFREADGVLLLVVVFLPFLIVYIPYPVYLHHLFVTEINRFPKS